MFVLYSTGKNVDEREYIRNEARRLVRRNMKITEEAEIRQKVAEFEARIALGQHYGIAAPRHANVIPGSTGEKPEIVRPVYLDSYRGGILPGQKPHRAPIPHESE